MNDDDTVEDVEELLRQARAQRAGELRVPGGAGAAGDEVPAPSGPVDDETIAVDDRVFVGGRGDARPGPDDEETIDVDPRLLQELRAGTARGPVDDDVTVVADRSHLVTAEVGPVAAGAATPRGSVMAWRVGGVVVVVVAVFVGGWWAATAFTGGSGTEVGDAESGGGLSAEGGGETSGAEQGGDAAVGEESSVSGPRGSDTEVRDESSVSGPRGSDTEVRDESSERGAGETSGAEQGDDVGVGTETSASTPGESDIEVGDVEVSDPPQAGGDHLGDGSLGVVAVEPGYGIQIRTVNAITGLAAVGLPNERSVVLAIEDYGQVRGFDVDLGTPLDDSCSYDGGQTAARSIVADEGVVGVVGLACFSATVAAAPLFAQAGMVVIDGWGPEPTLTSDLAGKEGPDHSVGYYRTADNPLFEGVAMAEFVHNELGIDRAAAIHRDGGYTESVAQAFADAFRRMGGTVTRLSRTNWDNTDMVPMLTEIAADRPGALFFPVFQPEGDLIADQAPGVPGLENAVLLAASGLRHANFLVLPQTTGMYFSGPDTRFDGNRNQSTGKTAAEVLVAYEARHGETPTQVWAPSYDATTLLLEAIEAASYRDGDRLMIDRQGVRDYLDSVEGYRGLTGTISCDAFGDCGANSITVVQNIGGAANVEASLNNIVYSFSPP